MENGKNGAQRSLPSSCGRTFMMKNFKHRNKHFYSKTLHAHSNSQKKKTRT